MTDHKFTDDDVIKALECCTLGDCYPCCYRIGGVDCRDRMQKDALALINRQKAEIEKWKKNCDELYEQMSERQKAEVEIAKRLGKSEAIKEFAEKLKGKAEFTTIAGYRDYCRLINALVKIMTEDGK